MKKGSYWTFSHLLYIFDNNWIWKQGPGRQTAHGKCQGQKGSDSNVKDARKSRHSADDNAAPHFFKFAVEQKERAHRKLIAQEQLCQRLSVYLRIIWAYHRLYRPQMLMALKNTGIHVVNRFKMSFVYVPCGAEQRRNGNEKGLGPHHCPFCLLLVPIVHPCNAVFLSLPSTMQHNESRVVIH